MCKEFALAGGNSYVKRGPLVKRETNWNKQCCSSRKCKGLYVSSFQLVQEMVCLFNKCNFIDIGMDFLFSFGEGGRIHQGVKSLISHTSPQDTEKP